MRACHGLRSLDGATGVSCSSAPMSEGGWVGWLASGGSASVRRQQGLTQLLGACRSRILAVTHRTGMGVKPC